MTLLRAFINGDSVSLLRFSLRSHFQDISWTISLVCPLKYPYSCCCFFLLFFLTWGVLFVAISWSSHEQFPLACHLNYLSVQLFFFLFVLVLILLILLLFFFSLYFFWVTAILFTSLGLSWVFCLRSVVCWTVSIFLRSPVSFLGSMG